MYSCGKQVYSLYAHQFCILLMFRWYNVASMTLFCFDIMVGHVELCSERALYDCTCQRCNVLLHDRNKMKSALCYSEWGHHWAEWSEKISFPIADHTTPLQCCALQSTLYMCMQLCLANKTYCTSVTVTFFFQVCFRSGRQIFWGSSWAKKIRIYLKNKRTPSCVSKKIKKSFFI